MSTKATANLTSGYIDLATYDDIDRELYGGDEVTTWFSKEIQPFSWFVRLPVPLKAQGQTTNPTYSFAKSADFVTDCWYQFTTPDIVVKTPEIINYRIAYTANLGHNVCKSATLQFNDLPAVTFDNVAMDALSEYNLSSGKYTAYMRMIGNVSKAVDWGSHLPPIKIKKSLHELWFTGGGEPHPEDGLPLCLVRLNTVSLQFEFVDELDKLIRVQKNMATVPGTDPDDWQDEDPKNVNLANIVDVVDSSKGLVLPLPEVWADYVLVTKAERDDHKKQTRDVVIEQVQKFTGPKEAVGSYRHTFHFSYPMRYLTFMAENITAADKYNYSNYTSKPEDSSGGIDPIRKVTLWYDNTPRIQNMGGDHFAELEPFHHAERVPDATGYHLHSYCFKTTSRELDGASDYSRLSTDLEIELNETSTDTDDTATTASSYKLQIRGISNNVIRFEDNSMGFPSFEQ